MFTLKNRFIDLLNFNPQLILMLPRFGMKLGFGEKKVEEICAMNNVPASMFILLCNVYSFDDYIPSEDEIKQIDTDCLVAYLVSSHDYYLNHRLKHIGNHIEKIAKEAGKIGDVLLGFFHEYEKEIAIHFMTEEKELFPNLKEIKKNSTEKFDTTFISETHGNIGDKLSDLTNIIIKYLPADIMPNERISVWFDIVQISKDLEKHTVIEEKILMPFVKWMKGGRI